MRRKAEVPAIEIEKQKEFMSRIRELFKELPEKPLAYVDTYGCQQNEADSETLRGMLCEMGYALTDDEYAADFIAINTCAIRENAENRVLGNVGALVHTKKARPSQMIAFCGCLAAVPETVEKIKNSYRQVDLVFPPNNLWRFPELMYSYLIRGFATDEGENSHIAFEMKNRNPHTLFPAKTTSARIFDTDNHEGAIAEGLPVQRKNKYKAWLPVMYGCDNYCSYCIVPHVRGRERSRKAIDVLEDARKLILDGCKEITLLGQNVNSYGRGLDEKISFAALIRRINEIEGEFLIRFMTSHPKDASGELFCAMAESKKAARHLHLPFQAGNDRVLKLMNRGYTQSEYLEKVAAARELMPDIVLTSDVIVGFPGETDKDFEDTLSLVKKARFDAMFTFIYSKRPGTPAAEMQDTSTREEKQERFDKLIELHNSIAEEKHSQYIGKTLKVFVDELSHDERYPLKARTNGGRLVHFEGDTQLLGSFVDAEITNCNSWSLFGEHVLKNT